jgi:hypothetical protein
VFMTEKTVDFIVSVVPAALYGNISQRWVFSVLVQWSQWIDAEICQSACSLSQAASCSGSGDIFSE